MKDLLSSLDFPPNVVEFLCSLFEAIQLFDDVADGDSVSRETLNSVIFTTFAGLVNNPFFAGHAVQLSALLETQILKWQASDVAERNGRADEKSFVWRSGFYDVVLYCASVVHGHTKASGMAEGVLRLYGEKYADYAGEFHA